jgi:predicted permease
VEEEIEFHIEMRMEELVAEGLTRDEARKVALRSFGDIEFTKRYCAEQSTRRHREEGRGMKLEELVQDLGYAWRTLRRNPSYTGIVVVTLALGIAANTVVFSVMNPYFFRELPFGEADQLVQVGLFDPVNNWDGGRFSLAMIDDFTNQSSAFEDVAAYYYGTANITGEGPAERVEISWVTENMFSVLRSDAVLGRTFAAGEGGPAGEDVVVLSHGMWQRRYAGDRGVLGSPIVLDGVPHTIIGVMPAEFGFPFNSIRMWVPVQEDATSQGRESNYYMPVGRLGPGWTAARVSDEWSGIQNRLAEAYPEIDGRFAGVSVKGLREALNFAYEVLRVAFGVLLAAVLSVLLIACVNVASLTLARGSSRVREVAVRAAIGAGRARIVRQLLTESVLLAVLGGVLGVALAYIAAGALGPLIPEELFRVGDIGIDARVLLFSAAITLATPLLFGLAPALKAARVDLQAAMAQGGERAGGAGKVGARRALVVLEVAMAVALISGTGLMIRSFLSIQNLDLGFEAASLLTVEVTPPETAYEGVEELNAYYELSVGQLAALPGVRGVGQTSWLPLNHESFTRQFARPGLEPATAEGWPVAVIGRVSPEYFDAMGIPLASGRTFGIQDGPDDANVVIVSELLARRHFSGESAVGQTLLFGNPLEPVTATIVGVVGDVRHVDLQSDPGSYLYRPLAQTGGRRRFLTVAADGTPSALAGSVRQTLAAIDADLPVQIRPMRDVVQENTLQWSVGMLFMGVFGAVALLLASLGIYGVISYSVAQRSREIGIRIAMGASGSEVRRLVVGEGLRLTGIGMGIGLVLALVAGKLMASMLFGVSSFDPMTLTLVLATFSLVSLMASLIPASRAGRVDPLRVLRAE